MSTSTEKAASKKPKLVRDSFTFPKAEYAAIEQMKTRAISLGHSVKKSELMRAGLKLLQDLNDNAFKSAIAAVPMLKTGRPAATAAAEPPVKAVQKPLTAVAAPAAAVTKPITKVAKPAVKASTATVAKPVAKPAAKPATKAAAKPAAKASVTSPKR